MNINNIQYILFDFGGVLYEINQNKTIDKLRPLISENSSISHIALEDLSKMDVFTDFETGVINPVVFRKKVRNIFDLILTDNQIDELWNDTLIAPFQDTYEFISKLTERYHLALLSNTNEIHFQYFYPQCAEFLEYFQYQFYSFRIGMRKPNLKVFEYAIEQLNTTPDRILFIDDLINNVAAADKAGMLTFHFDYETNRKGLYHKLLT